MQLGGSINEKNKTGDQTSWTPVRKNQLIKLANNRKDVWSKIRCFPKDN